MEEEKEGRRKELHKKRRPHKMVGEKVINLIKFAVGRASLLNICLVCKR